MFSFQFRNVISIPCVVSTHSSENNVNKAFWRITFIKFIGAG